MSAKLRELQEKLEQISKETLAKAWSEEAREAAAEARKRGEGGGGDMVEHHKVKLTAALAEPADFEKAFADIQGLDTPTLKKLARSFSGTSATSRADALDRIKSRHTSLMAAGARALAYGGRTAG